MSEKPAIGIDLGTTYSCVGVWKNNQVHIIPNDFGSSTTPSVVSFTNDERLIGQAAKNQITKNYKNTIYDAKRLIGRRFTDITVQNDINIWPFEVSKDERTDRPVIIVEYKGQNKKYYAEEISAMILHKMKQISEEYLGKKIEDAVITVPAYFNDSQRQSTKDAGRIAGLNVLRIINEPTAAAIAYGLNKINKSDSNILIFDLGGGTFDISILTLCDDAFQVKATKGDTHLGGEDFDNLLVQFCMKEFKNQSDIDIRGNQKALRRLKLACEKAKKDLSTSLETTIDIDALSDGEDLSVTISRIEFENMCEEYFRKCITILKEALKDAKIRSYQIDEIVLIGGSTRIPKIQELVKEFFNGKELCKSINPDEAVAYGAAYQAAMLNDNEENGIEKLVLLDVTPLSLGVELVDGSMSVIVKRNSLIPLRNKQIYNTAYEYQKFIPISIYQGERKKASENHLLGEFIIEGIQVKRKGEVQCEVVFELDVNSILKVKACELGTSNRNELVIKCNNNKLSESEIQELIEEANKLKADDDAIVSQKKAKVDLENFIIQLKRELHNYGNKRERIARKLEEVKKWIKDVPIRTIQEYQNKKKEIETFIISIMRINV